MNNSIDLHTNIKILCCDKKYAFPITGILKHLTNRFSNNFRSLRTSTNLSHIDEPKFNFSSQEIGGGGGRGGLGYETI